MGLLAVGGLAVALTRQSAPPPPASIAHDPVLVRGFAIYALRCASCHGDSARGDGRLAATLAGSKPRDMVADEWKYGDTADAVLGVLRNGCPGSAMPAYRGFYGEADLRAVAAYNLHLADRAVPRELRVP